MDVKIYNYLNQDAVRDNLKEASENASKNSVKATFHQTYEQAKRTETALKVDQILHQLKESGQNGFSLNSKIAYDLGLVKSYQPTPSASSAPAPSASTNRTSPITSVDRSSLPVDVTGHTTSKCPSHTGSSGYENTGDLKCSDELQKYFEQAAAATGVDVKLLKAVAYRESSFNPKDLSHAGAMGIMQLMPCNVEDYNIKDPYNAQQNILGGACELADYLNKYNGDLRLSLAAYNAGSGTVKKYGGVPEFCNRYIDRIVELYNS